MAVLASSANRAEPESVLSTAFMSEMAARWTVLGELEHREIPSTLEELLAQTLLAAGELQAALEVLERYGQVRVLLPLDDGPQLFASTARHRGKYVRCPTCGELSDPASHPLEPLRAELKRRFGHEFNLGRLIVASPCERCRNDDTDRIRAPRSRQHS